jgi:hypothetical protein
MLHIIPLGCNVAWASVRLFRASDARRERLFPGRRPSSRNPDGPILAKGAEIMQEGMGKTLSIHSATEV